MEGILEATGVDDDGNLIRYRMTAGEDQEPDTHSEPLHDDDHDRITLHLPPGKEPNVEIQRKIKDLDIILTIENLTK